MELRARLKRSYPETGDRRERLLSQRGRRVLKEGVKVRLSDPTSSLRPLYY
jgi:hypothetical protein